MDGIALSGIQKRYGSVTAVTDINLDLPQGKFISFLGPSGCGKTTLLRLIAGLEVPTQGSISLEGKDITRVATHQRNVGMVFQSLALFPHLSAGENIAYGLRVRGVDRQARRRKAEELLEMVQLPGLADRDIKQLSGGQRQRVAIARALALEPKLFLLDEPLSSLDANLREELQVELRMLQERLAITTIIVTHDQREAMTMSDLVVVMSTARVQQTGPPLEIYRHPSNSFVANFIGSSNLLDAIIESDQSVRIGQNRLEVAAIPTGAKPGEEVVVSIRPEDVSVLKNSEHVDNVLEGTVSFIRDVGASVETFVDYAGTSIVTISAPKERPDVQQGDRVQLELPAQACVVVWR